MSGRKVLLDVKDLSVDFRIRGTTIQAIESVSLQIHDGETVGIVGESGSGKSVTSMAIMGLIKKPGILRSGKVKFSENDMLKLSSRQRRQILGKDISMIFQEPTASLNPVMTILQQIEEVLKTHLVLSRTQRLEHIMELMQKVGMPEPEKILRSWPHQLSGGMNQRVMIAMALACKPSLLIADEPTTALDVTVQAQVLRLLQHLQQENNMGMLFISHDLSVVSIMADRILVMYAGQVVEECITDDLFQQALHPYTEALLKSLPENFIPGSQRLDCIPGIQSSSGQQHSGCGFQPRCQYARDICCQKVPDLVAADDISSRTVRCFFPLKYGDNHPGTES